jgi:hypothetical protein
VEGDEVGGCARVVAGAKALAYNGANANSRRVDRCMVVRAGQGTLLVERNEGSGKII